MANFSIVKLNYLRKYKPNETAILNINFFFDDKAKVFI